jgi:GTP-binding protein
VRFEPIEDVSIELDFGFLNILIDTIQNRKGNIINNEDLSDNRIRVHFDAPTRGLFGFRQLFTGLTKGNVIINSKLKGYEKYRGKIEKSTNGAIISTSSGKATLFALHEAEKHGSLFIGPGTEVYPAMVIGELDKEGEVEVNPCKQKHLTNVRTVFKEENLKIAPPKIKSIEDIMINLRSDELLEVTPKNLRIRKTIIDPGMRRKARRESKNEDEIYN